MQIQFGRAGSVLALGTLLTLAGSTASTAQNARRPENSLLGFTLLRNTYRDVLKRYGRPDEIQAGGPYVPVEGAPGAARPSGGAPKGGMMGGGPGMPGMMGMGGPGAPGDTPNSDLKRWLKHGIPAVPAVSRRSISTRSSDCGASARA